MIQFKANIVKSSWIPGLLLVISPILAPFQLTATEISEAEVIAAVQNWVRHLTADARPDAVVERPEPHRLNGKTVAYVAYLQNGGFCLGGADDLVLPVYFYSRYLTAVETLWNRLTQGSSSMITEIQWLRPFLMGGSRHASAGGGSHSWLVYGYSKGIAPDHQFLVNLGWGGSQDDWYTLDSMPFNLNQEQGIRIAPINVKFVGAVDPGDGSPDDPVRKH